MSLTKLLDERALAHADYCGARVPAVFEDFDLEWAAIDGSAALVDGRFRTTIVARGSERKEFLNGQLSHSILPLKPGCGTPALLLTPQAHFVSLIDVYELHEEIHLLVDIGDAERTIARLEQFLVADDVELAQVEQGERILLVGPDIGRRLQPFGFDIPAWPAPLALPQSWFVRRGVIADVDVTAYARGSLRVPIIELVMEEGGGQAVWEALEQAGLRPAGTEALESVRVESGTPRYGFDVDQTRLVLEARLEWAIHFRKGCYVGQEIIERAVSRGRVQRALSLFAAEGDVERGMLVEGTGEKDVVTSVARSTRHGTVCLGYTLRDLAVAGKRVELVARGGDTVGARVLPWPRPEIRTGR